MNVGLAVAKADCAVVKVGFAVAVQADSATVGFAIPVKADFAVAKKTGSAKVCCPIVTAADSGKTHFAYVDFAVVQKTDFERVCYSTVKSDSGKLHLVKAAGSATVGYAVVKADFASKGLAIKADSEKVVIANARAEFDQGDLYSERKPLLVSSLPRFPRFFSFSCLPSYLFFFLSLTLACFVVLFASVFAVVSSFLVALAALRVAVLVAVLFPHGSSFPSAHRIVSTE